MVDWHDILFFFLSFFFSSRRRHTRSKRDWRSDVCSSDLQPEAADTLRRLADAHAQQDPTFRTPLAYTRLTAKAALEALRTQGYGEAQLPAPSTMRSEERRVGKG